MLKLLALITIIIIFVKTGSLQEVFKFIGKYLLYPVVLGTVCYLFMGKLGLAIGSLVGVIIAFKTSVK